MKNLGIILSTWVLLFFAVACIKQEKDVFKSAEAEGRKNGTPIVLQEGGKDEIMTSCLAPTNFTIVGNVTTPSGIFTRYSWTPPAGGAWTYQVKYYLGSPSFLFSTTAISATQIDLPITANPNIVIEVRTICGNGIFSTPLTGTGGGGLTGGTSVIICDNLDNFTSVSGSYTTLGVTRTYTHSTAQLNLANNQGRLAVIFPTTPTTSQNIIPFSNIISSSSSAIIGHNFTVPNISGINSCLGDPLYFDVTVTLPPAMMGHFVAYKSPSGIKWQYVENIKGTVVLPNLLKGANYQLRVLSQYGNRPTTVAPNLCVPDPTSN